jgi:hypothetical protein
MINQNGSTIPSVGLPVRRSDSRVVITCHQILTLVLDSTARVGHSCGLVGKGHFAGIATPDACLTSLTVSGPLARAPL